MTTPATPGPLEKYWMLHDVDATEKVDREQRAFYLASDVERVLEEALWAALLLYDKYSYVDRDNPIWETTDALANAKRIDRLLATLKGRTA